MEQTYSRPPHIVKWNENEKSKSRFNYYMVFLEWFWFYIFESNFSFVNKIRRNAFESIHEQNHIAHEIKLTQHKKSFFAIPIVLKHFSLCQRIYYIVFLADHQLSMFKRYSRNAWNAQTRIFFQIQRFLCTENLALLKYSIHFE